METAPASIGCVAMYMLAGKTAINSAISPHAAAYPFPLRFFAVSALASFVSSALRKGSR